MKNGWQTKKLGELCEIELGRTPARANPTFWDEKRETSNVWLSIADLLNAEDNVVVDSKEYVSDKGAEICKLVPKGTLLVSFKLTLGRLAFAGRDLFTNEAIAALSIFNERELSKEFLFYFLHFFDWVKAAENDVKLKGMTLNKAKLKEIEVHFPKTLAEQQRIVGGLDEAFAGIATVQTNTEKNLQNARALFQSHLQSVFTQRGKGWVEKTLGDICETTQGVQIPKNFHHKAPGENRRRYLYISDFEHDENLKYVDDIHPNKRVTEKDLVVVNTGATAGKIFRGIDGVLSNNLFKVTLNHGIDSDFLYYFVTSSLFKEHQKKIVKGTANPHMGHENFKSTPVNIPPLEVQLETVTKLDKISAESNRLANLYERRLMALAALKQSLLHQSFTGNP